MFKYKGIKNEEMIISPQTMVTNLFESQKINQCDNIEDHVNILETSLVPYKDFTIFRKTEYLQDETLTHQDRSNNCEIVPQYFNLHCPMCGRLMPQKFYPKYNSNLSEIKKETPKLTNYTEIKNSEYFDGCNALDEQIIASPKSNLSSEREKFSTSKENLANYSVENENYFFFLEELYRQLNIRSNIKRMAPSVLNKTESSLEEFENNEKDEKKNSLEFIPINSSKFERKSEQNNLINLNSDLLMTGYYKKFFVEMKKLGSGSFGQVYLCAHVLDGITLARYAVKKVPVGDDRKWLSTVLREVKIRELLHHPNIVQYRHSWLEMYSSNDYCPKVPWLFQLMEYCNSGSLENLIPIFNNSIEDPKVTSILRSNVKRPRVDHNNMKLRVENSMSINNKNSVDSRCEDRNLNNQSLSLLIVNSKKDEDIEYYDGKYIHDHHIWKIFFDIILGLQHLHHRGILHRDLKPSNILLHVTFDEFIAQPICQALLSDFGTAQILKRGKSPVNKCELISVSHSNIQENQGLVSESQEEFPIFSNQRVGFTGTIEYTAPELLLKNENGKFIGEYNVYSDIWSLGITMYALCYNQVPFRVNTSSGLDPEDPEECIKAIFSGMNNLQFPDFPPRSLELRLLIKSLLEPDPENRPNTDDILRHPVIQEKLRSSDVLTNASIELAKIIQNKQTEISNSSEGF